MEDFNTYEYAAEQKNEGKFKTLRLLVILGYVLFAAAYAVVFAAILKIPQVIAVLPIFIWMLVFFTWKYTKPDYRYVIERGDMVFTVVYGKKKKGAKPKTSFKVSSAVAIAPKAELADAIREFHPKHIYSAVPSVKSTDVYAALYENGAGERFVFYFVATAAALKLLRFLNSKTVVTKTTY
jgi:hypothetical protein